MHELLPWTFHDACQRTSSDMEDTFDLKVLRHVETSVETFFKASKLFDEMLKRHVVPPKPQSGRWTHLIYDHGSQVSKTQNVMAAFSPVRMEYQLWGTA